MKSKISAKITAKISGMDPRKLLRNKKVIEEINRHKWLESEIAGYDIGFEAAAEDWLKRHAAVWVAYHLDKKSDSKIPIKSKPSATAKKSKRK